MARDSEGTIKGIEAECDHNELELIANVCLQLKDIALSADRKFLAHLLDLTIAECQEKPVLPISSLRDIAAQMRRLQFELSPEMRSGDEHRRLSA